MPLRNGRDCFEVLSETYMRPNDRFRARCRVLEAVTGLPAAGRSDADHLRAQREGSSAAGRGPAFHEDSLSGDQQVLAAAVGRSFK
jgi:hypothetical protein